MRTIIIFFTLFSLLSCSFKSDNEYIQNRFWKYGSGFHAKTDILILTNKNFLNDTIFIKKKPAAIFVSLDDFKSDLIIKSVATNELGYYHNQGLIDTAK